MSKAWSCRAKCWKGMSANLHANGATKAADFTARLQFTKRHLRVYLEALSAAGCCIEPERTIWSLQIESRRMRLATRIMLNIFPDLSRRSGEPEGLAFLDEAEAVREECRSQMVGRRQGRMAVHFTCKADAERLRRGFQRMLAGRVPKRTSVPHHDRRSLVFRNAKTLISTIIGSFFFQFVWLRF